MNAPTKHLSVTYYQPQSRKVFCTSYFNPMRAKRENKSLATRDETDAKDICVDIERICNESEWWNLDHPVLHTLNPRAVIIFFGEKPHPISAHVKVPSRFNKDGSPWAYKLHRSKELAKAHKKNAELTRKLKGRDEEVEELRKENTILRRKAGVDIKETLEEAVEAWKVGYPEGRKPRTVTDAFASVSSFVEFVGGNKPLVAVKIADIDKWIESYRNRKPKQKGKPVSPITKKRVRNCVSVFFNWANRHFDLPENPMDKAEPIPGVSRNPEHIKAIRKPDDLHTLLNALEPWPYWRAWVATACLAGPRFSEQVWLRAEDVHLDQGYIKIATITSGRRTLKGTKTGKERRIPIERTTLEPILKAYLASRKSDHPWLFPSLRTAKKRSKSQPGLWSSGRAFLDDLRKVLAAAKKNNNGAGEFWSYTQSEWRHCFGTALGHSGFNSYEISRLMGNSPDVAQQHYIGVRTQDLGNRWPFLWR